MTKKYGPRIQCLKCLKVIQSKHRHDWVPCECGDIFVDGGSDYLRMGMKENGYGYINLDVDYDKYESQIKEIKVTEDDGFIN